MKPEPSSVAGTGGTGGGSWRGRPSGIPGAVPPPSVPISFLAAAAAGLVACGGAWVWARGATALDPTSDPTVAAVHFGMLATLSMGVLGATHQFTPVITGRPLRSVLLARVTFVSWLAAAWMLPLGVATEQLAVTAASGALAGLTAVLLAVNVAHPLSVRGKGVPVVALRLAVAGAILTGFLGAAFVADRQGNWFALAGHVDLAMGVIGLFGWLGVTYVGVAEKLWPMFMLAHVPGRHLPGRLAVWGTAGGAALLTPGLGWGIPPMAVAGAAVLTAGLGGHLASLGSHVRHRRRKADLHLLFLLTSAAWLVTAAGLALAAVLELPRHDHLGMALAAAAVAAAGGWLLEALVGHVHKVVPFILWSALRARGVATGPTGRPLLFADLYDHTWAAFSYGTVTAGIATLCLGLAGSLPASTAAGGALFAVTGVVVAVNLSVVPLRLLRRRPPSSTGDAPPAEAPEGVHPPAPATASRQRTPTASFVAVALASVAVLMAASALWWNQPATTATPSAPATGPVIPNGRTKVVDVGLGQFYVRPSTVTLSAGTRLVLHVTNQGSMDHDLQLEGGPVGTGMLGPGQHRTVDYGVFGHSEQAWCTVAGHKAAGMVLDIAVRSRSGASAAGAAAATSARDATIDFSASPPAGWRAADPAVEPAPGGTVHHVTLVAEDEELEVAPGVTQDLWTWNGTVPGPILRGHVGDVFDITMVNHTDMDHSLDVHATSAPMEDLDMKEVLPGTSVTYQFQAEHAGVYLYHCGTSPMIEHLANGMYGAMIIDPPGLDPVAHEYAIVQAELYLGPQGQSGDYAKMLRGEPDAVVFDGYVNQYLHSPVRVRAGQRIRIFVVDAGPNDETSFHVVGAQFDTVYKTGAYLLRPGNPTDGAAQVLDLSPGQGGFVELTLPAPGHYLMVDHHLDHASTGAAGYLVAG